MNGHNAIAGHTELCLAHPIHIHFNAGAIVARTNAARNDVAVNAARQASAQLPAHLRRVAVERNKATATAAECDLIGAIIPPFAQRSQRANDVPEADHVPDLWPPMLAYPAVGALAGGRVECRRNDLLGRIARWAYRGEMICRTSGVEKSAGFAVSIALFWVYESENGQKVP